MKTTMNNAVKYLAAVSAFAFSGSAAFAQTSAPPPAPQKPGILSRLFHPKPKTGVYQSNGSAMHPMHGQPGMMGSQAMSGSQAMMGHVVGNKKTHVYHLPGDKGALPAPQNRVYFSSAAAAQAAGYHASGSGHAMTHGMMTHGMMTHGMMTHGTMMHGTMMHGPMMHR